jgi:hypothetical protein
MELQQAVAKADQILDEESAHPTVFYDPNEKTLRSKYSGSVAEFAQAVVLIGHLTDQNSLITVFDAPDAGTIGGQGTLGSGINDSGVISGYYYDSGNVPHGLVRASDGQITEFTAPGAIFTLAVGINGSGEVIGFSGSGGPQSGMLRTAVGVVTTFNAPDATNGTFGASINRAGGVTGLYFDLNNISHGFRRSVAGAPGAFNVPGAGTGAYQGTYPNSISDKGTIAGWFRDANNAVHGFLMLPPM